jgi:photosystem II stability/assembly factor-like uncharacterized protein
MRGDFSRTTFKPQHHYSGVRLQQGRVQLDAEFNEHVDIEAYRDEALTRDVVGPHGVPQEGGGFQIGVGTNLRDVDVAGTEIWAVGEDGTVLKATTGSQPWALQAVPAGAGRLNALHLTGAGQGWLVGDGGKAYELSSAQPNVWQPRPLPSGSAVDLFDVLVLGANVWVVGAGGTILRWDGSQWNDHKVAGVNGALRGIHFSGNTGWIVGDGGTLLTTTSATGPWQRHTTSGIATNLRAVHLPSATTGWAVGDGGAIYAWDDDESKWKRQPAPVGTAATLRDVDFAPGTTQGTIVGDDGTILRMSNGTGWAREAAPSTAHVRGVRVQSGTSAIAVGDNVALSRTNAGWARTSQALPSTARNITISAGDMYVDGLRIENEREVTFTSQPDRGEPLPTLGNASSRIFGFFVELQEQLLTALDRESLREVALGGPDSATRTRTVWHVKAAELTSGQSCPNLDTLLRDRSEKLGHARLRARAEPAPLATSECMVPPTGGFRRLENQLYRVEIHRGSEDPDGPSYKWSRENGSVTARLEAISRSTTDTSKGSVTVSTIGRDEVLGLAPEDLIEVTDEIRLLAGRPGLLLEIEGVNGNVLAVKGFTGSEQPSLAMFPLNPVVRRWEGQGDAVADGWLELEDGVQVQFAYVGPEAEAFRSGDHWTIPARTATGNVEWPRSDGVSQFEPARGPRARFAPLGVARLDANGWTALHDCRRKFPPLTGFVQLEYVGGDGQETMPDLTVTTHPANGPFYPLPRPLEVAVTNGKFPVVGARVKFERALNDLGRLTAVNAGGQMVTAASVETVTDAQGLASATWALDGNNLSQVVTATLIDDLDQAPPNPIHFNANLSVASQVAFDGRNCATLAPEKNVQNAITKVSRLTGVYPLTGTGFDFNPSSQPVTRQLEVIVVSGCGPVDGAEVTFTPAANSGTVQPSGPVVTQNGKASCLWTLDPAAPTQEVEAVLTKVPTSRVLHLPDRTRFVANLRLASETSYTTECPPLANVRNVKDALDALATMPRLHHLLGDGQHGRAGDPIELGVAVTSDCGPDATQRRVRFAVVQGDGTLEGVQANGVVDTTNGEARCFLRIGSERLHRVEASLVRTGTATYEPPVSFAITRLTAREIGFDPSKCPALEGVDNVQDAISGLCGDGGRAEPGVRIKDIRLRTAGILRLAAKVPVDEFVDGIDILTERVIDAQFLGLAVQVVVEVPMRTDFGISSSQPVVIPGEVSAPRSPIGIRWRPTDQSAGWLKSLLPIEGVEGVTARLRILGDQIVAVPEAGDETLLYLDAELFAQPPPQPLRVRDRVLDAHELATVDLNTRARLGRDLEFTPALRAAMEARDADRIESLTRYVPTGGLAALAALRAEEAPPSPRFPSGNGRAGGLGELWFTVIESP